MVAGPNVERGCPPARTGGQPYRAPGRRGWRPGARAARSEREHSADQCLPGHRSDDAVDGHRRHVRVDRRLEVADRGFGRRAEDPVDLHAVRRAAGEIAEPEFLLNPADGVAFVAPAYLDDQGFPRDRPDDAVDAEVLLTLEVPDRGFGPRPEGPVHGDRMPTGTEQMLQRGYGVFLGSLARLRPGAQCTGHVDNPFRATVRYPSASTSHLR